MLFVHICLGYTANALIGSQESRFLPLPKHDHPPFAALFFTIHSKALLTCGWSEYPNLTRARAQFPVMQRCPFFEPSSPNPPSSFPSRSIQSSHASAILASDFVNPRSDKTRSIQFVDKYFGLYRLSPDTHQPPAICLERISAPHPSRGILSFA